jgi:hypothetical protein
MYEMWWDKWSDWYACLRGDSREKNVATYKTHDIVSTQLLLFLY